MENYPKKVDNAQLFSDKNHRELNYNHFWIIFHHFPTYFEWFLETINHFSTNIQQNPPVVAIIYASLLHDQV